MEISFFLIVIGLGALFTMALCCFFFGWFLGNGTWDERGSGYQSQIRELRERLAAAEKNLEEERTISGKAMTSSPTESE